MEILKVNKEVLRNTGVRTSGSRAFYGQPRAQLRGGYVRCGLDAGRISFDFRALLLLALAINHASASAGHLV
jgi:hypothetical protein